MQNSSHQCNERLLQHQSFGVETFKMFRRKDEEFGFAYLGSWVGGPRL